MIPTENDKQGTCGRRYENQPILSESIGIEETSSELLISN